MLKKFGTNFTRFSPIGSVILGLIILGIARNFTLLLLSQVLFGCAYGISYPLFLDQSIKYTTPNNRGVGMGMFQSIYAIGMFGGPLFSTYLNAKFGLMMTVSILSFTVLIFYFSGLIWYDHLISKFISTNTGN